jgi:hypothetical protein
MYSPPYFKSKLKFLIITLLLFITSFQQFGIEFIVDIKYGGEYIPNETYHLEFL